MWYQYVTKYRISYFVESIYVFKCEFNVESYYNNLGLSNGIINLEVAAISLSIGFYNTHVITVNENVAVLVAHLLDVKNCKFDSDHFGPSNVTTI